MYLSNAQRVVIKIGSSLLVGADGAVRAAWLKTFASDIAALRAEGKEVLVVSSGAVGLGRAVLRFKNDTNLKLAEKQAAAACGQIALIDAWKDALNAHNIPTAQMLLTLGDSEHRKRYLNARATLNTLLAKGAVPIINENDTVATAELRVGDNDRLAARVAQMAGADVLLMFSDVDGLYDANPAKNVDAKRFDKVEDITDDIRSYASGSGSNVGTGGMVTKLDAAEIAMGAGCHMVIASGTQQHPIKRIADGGAGTWFIAKESAATARKAWIAGALNTLGTFTVDDGAASALTKGNSLLSAGVVACDGVFDRGDAIVILDSKGIKIAHGLAAYSADDSTRILGKKSDQIEAILGYHAGDTLIHRDDLVLL